MIKIQSFFVIGKEEYCSFHLFSKQLALMQELHQIEKQLKQKETSPEDEDIDRLTGILLGQIAGLDVKEENILFATVMLSKLNGDIGEQAEINLRLIIGEKMIDLAPGKAWEMGMRNGVAFVTENGTTRIVIKDIVATQELYDMYGLEGKTPKELEEKWGDAISSTTHIQSAIITYELDESHKGEPEIYLVITKSGITHYFVRANPLDVMSEEDWEKLKSGNADISIRRLGMEKLTLAEDKVNIKVKPIDMGKTLNELANRMKSSKTITMNILKTMIRKEVFK